LVKSEFRRIAAKFGEEISRAIGNGVWLMTVKAGLIPVALGLLAVLVGTGFNAGSARAQDACLDAPNGPAPQGTQWYFKTDRSSQRKCWYVRSQDQAAQPAPAEELPEPASAPATPPPVANVPAHVASVPAAAPIIPMPRARPVLAATNGGAAPRHDVPQARSPSNAVATAWVDPAPAPAASGYAWPDPPSPAVDAGPPAPDSMSHVQPASVETATQGTTPGGPRPAAGASSKSQEVVTGSSGALESAKPAPVSTAPAPVAQGGSSAEPAAGVGTGQTTGPQNPAPIGLLLASALGLLFVGIVLRRIVTKAFAHRQKIRVERQEPVLVEGNAATPGEPTLLTRSPSLVPERSSNEQQVAEVEDALRKLAQRLRQRRLTPFKTIAPFFSSGSVGARARP